MTHNQADLCTSEKTYGYNAEDIGLLYFAYSIFTPLLVFLTGQILPRVQQSLIYSIGILIDKIGANPYDNFVLNLVFNLRF